MASPPNFTTVSVVAIENPFCLSLSERLRPLQIPRVAGYGPKHPNTAWFPPAANDYEIKYHVSDMTPPLLNEDEGPST
jgi:hypothetical protein